jgi:hypothetical protein
MAERSGGLHLLNFVSAHVVAAKARLAEFEEARSGAFEGLLQRGERGLAVFTERITRSGFEVSAARDLVAALRAEGPRRGALLGSSAEALLPRARRAAKELRRRMLVGLVIATHDELEGLLQRVARLARRVDEGMKAKDDGGAAASLPRDRLPKNQRALASSETLLRKGNEEASSGRVGARSDRPM